jgi:hypothetical protein
MKKFRKSFVMLLMISGISLLIVDCSGSTSKSAPVVNGGNCLVNGTAVTIGSNHGHVMNVPIADITADVGKDYDIRGTNTTHTHTVSLSKSDFDSLKLNQGVSVQSSAASDGHSHSIVVNCQ